ncbi:MAG: ATP-binding protein [Oscillibacter sp.]
MLRLSRLPTKAPRTFENFDFSLLKGRDVERLKALPSLSAIYSHRNLAFIGPAGTGQDSFGASIWLRLLPARYENLLH